ncbi:LysM peptidoglycan-binding domain-containing protein [Micromonospora fiedleri]|uniref:LysM peptidoglycan-binding domain-containing protein n=1 Tax=Micromonospora fiedleri TaxID=1157498 RepID=A0ABS1UKL4_9ACTN|nr:LysM domain-containing protein [Micromonospora fiedleri]MBL6276886.1 LysM peptidoglycan-binding domain-containing protein [Micromonospora fiedleri]
MAASGGTAVRRLGRILTGFGALVVLLGLLVGGPIALLAFAGNPLPDHVPTLAEIGTTLTSRDDGQLFLRALALVGWFGWATFAISVLVELGAQALRRPAPRLPGMGRQQRAAAALVGSVALILVASPAAAATAAYTSGPYTAPTATVAYASPAPSTTMGSQATVRADLDAPVYQVAKGDYLGKVADRYLDDFDDYRKLAALNGLRNPDQIRPGQLITLPTEAKDQGVRAHATGRLVTPKRPSPAPVAPDSGAGTPTPTKPDGSGPGGSGPGGTGPGGATQDGATRGGASGQPGGSTSQPGSATPAPAAPEDRQPTAPRDKVSDDHPPVVTVGAARAGDPDRVNRPLAISAVLAVASIVGAQIGAVLGLRRRPVTTSASTWQHRRSSAPRELPTGRHRKD